MLNNYLKVAVRNLLRQKGYTVLNVLGLSCGMACCLLVGLYIRDELSYDRFHEGSDRLMTLIFSTNWGTGLSTPYPLASLLERDLPEVQYVVRTWGPDPKPVFRSDGSLRSDRQILYADPSFFQTFSFPLINGEPDQVLIQPNDAVISETTANIFFGGEDPIGKTLRIQQGSTEQEVTIRGVAKDSPHNSTIYFDMVLPLNALDNTFRNENAWDAAMYRTYVLLRQPLSADEFSNRIGDVVARHIGDMAVAPGVTAMPLSSLYLSDFYSSGSFGGQSRYIRIFSIMAAFVLVTACINYINLVTAQSTRRTQEVGVRKSFGASRGHLVGQFLTESLLLNILALAASFLLVIIALPAFNALFDKELVIDIRQDGAILIFLGAIVLLLALPANVYPAIALSRFSPSKVLRGSGITTTSRKGRYTREGLVVLQFAISTLLIAGTIVIYNQLQYVRNKNLGFNGDQVITVRLPWGTDQMRDVLKNEALTTASIASASVATGIPGSFGFRRGDIPRLFSPDTRSEAQVFEFYPGIVDFDFVKTLGLNIISGRDFNRNYPSDETQAFILNEAAAQEMGWTPGEAVGKPFDPSGSGSFGEVIGVVENFHIHSLRLEIAPVVLQLHPDPTWSSAYFLAAKLSADNIQAGVDHLRKVIVQANPGTEFDYVFLDERFDSMYRSEEQLNRIFSSFAVIAIIISCLGLFALAAFNTGRRSKEIGIRKVYGATETSIVRLLIRDLVKPVVAGLIIAAPLAYIAAQQWLDNFAYRQDPHVGIFLLAGGAALLIALLTVSFHALRTALANPIDSLRHE
jgi:putative ABC transport system permease protein